MEDHRLYVKFHYSLSDFFVISIVKCAGQKTFCCITVNSLQDGHLWDRFTEVSFKRE